MRRDYQGRHAAVPLPPPPRDPVWERSRRAEAALIVAAGAMFGALLLAGLVAALTVAV